MSRATTLTTIPIINLSKEDEDFRYKVIDFLLENSVDFDRDIIFDEENPSSSTNQKNGTTFNAMIRIFNIRKNSLTPQKKLPHQIRPSIYKNLISRPIDEELKERVKIKKNQSPKPKNKKKSTTLLKLPEKAKNFRAIRYSVYSHLVKFSPSKSDEKNFEELNKIFKTPEKKKHWQSVSNEGSKSSEKQKRSQEKLKRSGKSQSNSKSSERCKNAKNGSSVTIKKISRETVQKNTIIKRVNVKKKKEKTSPKTEINQTQNKGQQLKVQDTVSTTKKDQKINKSKPLKNSFKAITKANSISNKNNIHNNNSESYSFEVPSLSVSAMNKMYDDLLNKTYELRKSEISFQAVNSDEEIKDLCEKIKPKSGFHESQKLGEMKESESFKKTEESTQNKNILFDESNEVNKNSVDNKDLVEKLDKILESQKLTQKNADKKSMEEKFDKEFVYAMRKNSGDLDKIGRDSSPNTLNRNFAKVVDRFFVGMEFLSSQELLCYYQFILNRAKLLYIKFIKTRGLLNI